MRIGRRIVVCVHDIPGQGGGATAAYDLVQRMQGDAIDAWFLSLVPEEAVDYYRFTHGEDFDNPRGLPNVRSCVVPESAMMARGPYQPLGNLLDSLAADVVVSNGFIAALLAGRSAPERTLVFLTEGCEQAASWIQAGRAPDLISLLSRLELMDRPPDILHSDEQAAVRVSDLVVTHSDAVGDLYRRFYPSDEGRVLNRTIWMAEWIVDRARPHQVLARPWEERSIDLLFVANRWSRFEKNLPMVERIVEGCGDLNVTIVGDLPGALPGAHHKPFVASPEEMFRIFGDAKAVIAPSVLDAAPGVLFEASAMGCNVVTSPNCGNWELCNPALLVDPPEGDRWVAAARRAAERQWPDHMDRFLHDSSYSALVETLAVV